MMNGVRIRNLAFAGAAWFLAGTWGASAESSGKPLLSPRAAEQEHGSVRMKRLHIPPPWHSVEVDPPPALPKIHSYDKVNPAWWFQNLDDPYAPSWYREAEGRREMNWKIRNMSHNLTFYVIGVADKKTVRSGRYPMQTSNPRGGWNVAVTRYKWLYLPFVDYHRGGFEFYFGWRERGNFGTKINIK